MIYIFVALLGLGMFIGILAIIFIWSVLSTPAGRPASEVQSGSGDGAKKKKLLSPTQLLKDLERGSPQHEQVLLALTVRDRGKDIAAPSPEGDRPELAHELFNFMAERRLPPGWVFIEEPELLSRLYRLAADADLKKKD